MKHIIDKIEKLEIKNKDTDVVVMTFDPEKININEAAHIYHYIDKAFPNHNLICVPKNVEFVIENIDYLINKLQQMKREKKNENIY